MYPKYHEAGVRYHPAFDYYALGVIHLEIALWRPVEKTLPPEEPAEVLKTRLVERAMNHVSQRMGIGFRDLIIARLAFHDIHGSEREGSSLVRKFQQEILENALTVKVNKIRPYIFRTDSPSAYRFSIGTYEVNSLLVIPHWIC